MSSIKCIRPSLNRYFFSYPASSSVKERALSNLRCVSEKILSNLCIQKYLWAYISTSAAKSLSRSPTDLGCHIGWRNQPERNGHPTLSRLESRWIQMQECFSLPRNFALIEEQRNSQVDRESLGQAWICLAFLSWQWPVVVSGDQRTWFFDEHWVWVQLRSFPFVVRQPGSATSVEFSFPTAPSQQWD